MSDEWLDQQEFYELMLAYRHAKVSCPGEVVHRFEQVKSYIRQKFQQQATP